MTRGPDKTILSYPLWMVCPVCAERFKLVVNWNVWPFNKKIRSEWLETFPAETTIHLCKKVSPEEVWGE